MRAATSNSPVPIGASENGNLATSNGNSPDSTLAQWIIDHKVVRIFSEDASLVLIGVRGAGKRSLGFIAATHLGRRFITEGLYFEEVTGLSKAAYLRQHGKISFYHRNLEVFKQMLERNERNCILECGMVSLIPEAQALLRQFAQSHPVVHVVRNFDHISRQLNIQERDLIHLKKEDLKHRQCSNLEFYNLFDGTAAAEREISIEDFNSSSPVILQHVKTDFHKYVDSVFGRSQEVDTNPFSVSAIAPEMKLRSYVSFVRLSSLIDKTVNPRDLESGEDAIELCVNVWNPTIINEISKQVSLLRREMHIPIILSVMNRAFFNPRLEDATYAEILTCGLRLEIDYIAIDMARPEILQNALAHAKGSTKAIADFHFENPSLRAWLESNRINLCEMARNQGFDLIRMTQPAIDRQDNRDAQQFARIALQTCGLPIIAYNLGYLGKSSKVFNNVLSPVKHHNDLPTTAHEDQPESGIWIREATAALFHCFELDRLHFHVFGQSVFFSRSPSIQQAAFHLYGMPHDFSFREISSFEEVLRLAKDPFFGGAAISFPFKEEAFRACDATSLHASVIGSINTFLPIHRLPGEKTTSLVEQAKHRGTGGEVVGFYGDNSDWEGIYNNIRRMLSPRNAAGRKTSTGLVLGAGGSARSAIYALLRLGCQSIYIYNRTFSNAGKVAHHFNTWYSTQSDTNDHSPVMVLDPGEREWPRGANLPTIIVSCVPIDAFELPESWLQNPSGGVVADVSYNPPQTPFLKQIKQLRDKTGISWAIVTGIDIVYEQGIIQFEQMTGYRAPRKTMKKALYP